MYNSEHIFNKYALGYESKYMDISLYQGAINRFLEIIDRPEATILDVGCGPGNISKYLLERSPAVHIIGVDIAENMVELAQKNNPGASFRKMDCRNIIEIDRKFSGIIAGFVIPYLSRTEVLSFIHNCSKLLESGGILYLSFMNAGSEKSELQTSSENKQDKLLTYYHRPDFILSCFKINGLSVINDFSLNNPVNKEGVTDMVIIAKK